MCRLRTDVETNHYHFGCMSSFKNQDLRSQQLRCTSLAAILSIHIHMEVEGKLQIFGIHVEGETEFYGIIQQILEVEYPGLLNLKCVIFKCDWFDPVIDRGVRKNNLGVVDVNANKTYSKFKPFILALQAGQVSFLSYPRVRSRREVWLSLLK